MFLITPNILLKWSHCTCACTLYSLVQHARLHAVHCALYIVISKLYTVQVHVHCTVWYSMQYCMLYHAHKENSWQLVTQRIFTFKVLILKPTNFLLWFVIPHELHSTELRCQTKPVQDSLKEIMSLFVFSWMPSQVWIVFLLCHHETSSHICAESPCKDIAWFLLNQFSEQYFVLNHLAKYENGLEKIL